MAAPAQVPSTIITSIPREGDGACDMIDAIAPVPIESAILTGTSAGGAIAGSTGGSRELGGEKLTVGTLRGRRMFS